MVFKKQLSLGLLLFSLLMVGEGVFLPLLPVMAGDDAEDLSKDIKDIEDKLKKAEAKKATLEKEVNTLSSSLSQADRTIAETRIKIQQAENTIERKVAEIELLEAKMTEERDLLEGLLQDLYYEGYVTLPELLIARDDFASLINHPDRLLSVKERIRELLDVLQNRQTESASQKVALEAAKVDHQELLGATAVERQGIASDRAEVLDDVADQEKIISRLQKELRELQGDLAVLTGKNYNAKDIHEAVGDASDEAKVSEGVLYGFLKMETNLGANTGQCTYKEVKDSAMSRYYSKNKKKYKNSIDLLEKRYNLFLDLVDGLGYSKNKKVSCTPSGYVGQGGAMGVAQFMSDVWIAYSGEIRAKTGHKTPDPWNLSDGVMAMAIKVKKAGAPSDGCSAVAIRKASISYLGAFNQGYYNGITYWCKNYKQLFN